MYPGEHFCWGEWWMFPMIVPIVFIVVMVIVLYSFFGRGSWRDRHADKKGETALDILKKRYARGELNKEAFERMKKDISD